MLFFTNNVSFGVYQHTTPTFMKLSKKEKILELFKTLYEGKDVTTSSLKKTTAINDGTKLLLAKTTYVSIIYYLLFLNWCLFFSSFIVAIWSEFILAFKLFSTSIVLFVILAYFASAFEKAAKEAIEKELESFLKQKE